MQLVAMQSMVISAGGDCQKVATSTTHAESTAINSPFLILYSDAAIYVRAGATPVALATGVDAYIPAGIHYRVPWNPGDKISAITLTGTGVLYLTPDTPGRSTTL